MRALLGILLSILLLQSQVFALSGGPDYNRGGGGITNIVGTYGGVMTQITTDEATSGGSIGVYSVGIATSGQSTGNIVIFNRGRVYPGTITGLGNATNPSNATFKGIIEAQFNYTLSTIVTNTDSDGNTTSSILTQQVTTTTNGVLDTTIATTRTGPVSSTLMTGTAVLSVSNGFVDGAGNLVISEQISYDVSGYRQTATAL